MNYESAYKLLEEKGQLPLLRYYDELKSDEQQALLSQIDQIDFSLIDMIGKNNSGNDSDIAPVAALQLDAINANHDTYLNAGIDTIKNGDLALVLLAGGQGTRLGFSGPKGYRKACRYMDTFLYNDE